MKMLKPILIIASLIVGFCLLFPGCRDVKYANGSIYIKFNRELDDSVEKSLAIPDYDFYYKVDLNTKYGETFGERRD